MRENLYPRELVHKILEQTLRNFLAVFGETPFLCVRINGPTDTILDDLLEHYAPRSRRNTSPTGEPAALEFHTRTAYQGSKSSRADIKASAPQSDVDTKAIRERMASAPHAIVPLVKRKQETAYIDRISIGRSRNKDVVLRHESVSKFHAWLETDGSGAVFIADAGSKNGTVAKAERIESRTLTRLDSGDEVRFGSVRAVFLLPETLWEIVHDK